MEIFIFILMVFCFVLLLSPFLSRIIKEVIVIDEKTAEDQKLLKIIKID